MNVHYSEEEQIEKLKQWWSNYGASVIIGVVLGLGLLGGTKYWNYYSTNQSQEAAQLYDQLLIELQQNQAEKIQELGAKLIQKYARTPYAEFAVLILAKSYYDTGEIEKAADQLRWAVDKARPGAARETARLRLVRLVAEQGKIDSALALMDDDIQPGFETEYYELKGDLLLRNNETDNARNAYQNALKGLAPGSPYREILQMKLDNLGRESS